MTVTEAGGGAGSFVAAAGGAAGTAAGCGSFSAREATAATTKRKSPKKMNPRLPRMCPPRFCPVGAHQRASTIET
jgi:hypothetical protein